MPACLSTHGIPASSHTYRRRREAVHPSSSAGETVHTCAYSQRNHTVSAPHAALMLRCVCVCQHVYQRAAGLLFVGLRRLQGPSVALRDPVNPAPCRRVAVLGCSSLSTPRLRSFGCRMSNTEVFTVQPVFELEQHQVPPAVACGTPSLSPDLLSGAHLPRPPDPRCCPAAAARRPDRRARPDRQVREVLRILLHTIVFNRALGPVKPVERDSELFEITWVRPRRPPRLLPPTSKDVRPCAPPPCLSHVRLLCRCRARSSVATPRQRGA